MGFQSQPQRYLDKKTIGKVASIAAHHSQPNKLNHTKKYVFGDIHGMDKLLIELLDFVTSSSIKKDVVGDFIFLGDYVDRGPGVAQVLAIVRLLQEIMPKGRVITLMGNHEDMFLGANLRYVSGRAQSDFYLSNTGQSFSKYGANALPPSDLLKWMNKLPHYYEDEMHYYVHAGIVPGIPIENQDIGDLLWIREPFLKSKVIHHKYILHGHTPKEDIDLQPNRCGIDTGACFGSKKYLTCAEVNSDYSYPVGFYQVRNDNYLYYKLNEGKYKVSKFEKENINV